jgi:hypothetical protein
MTKDEALRLALGALIEVRDANIHGLTLTQDYHDAITAIKAALEAPHRTWVGLTADEYAELAEEYGPFPINQIEAKLKEKNT